MKALVVRLSSIGDVVHTLPALAALRRAGWEAGWLVEPPARVLLEGNPAVSEVFAAPPAKAFALARPRSRRCARCGRAATTWRSTSRACGSPPPGRASRAPRASSAGRRASRREPASQLLIGERVARKGDRRRHVIDKNLELLAPLGIAADGAREFPLPRPAGARSPASTQGLAGDRRRARSSILNPGGGWASKLWPAERFGELARGLRASGLRPLVSWGPGEQDLADRVVAASGGAARALVPDDAARLRRAGAPRTARGGRRHRPAAHRLCRGHAGRRALRPDRSGAQRAVRARGRRPAQDARLCAVLQPELRAPRRDHERDRRRGGPGRAVERGWPWRERERMHAV